MISRLHFNITEYGRTIAISGTWANGRWQYYWTAPRPGHNPMTYSEWKKCFLD